MAPEVSLHRSLYDAGAVEAVASLYAGVARVTVLPAEHELTVRFEQVDPDVADVLVDHFCNHVLAETVVRRNQAEATLRGDGGGAT